MHHTWSGPGAIVLAGVVIGFAGSASADMMITSVNRSVSAELGWSALFEFGAFESQTIGPDTSIGQWDATAEAYAVDPDYDPGWNQHVFSTQHSDVATTGITADMSIDIQPWTYRPSLGSMSWSAENILNFTFTVGAPIPVIIDLGMSTYASSGVWFEHSLSRTGGGFARFGNNFDDYGEYGHPDGYHFEGILEPGEYVFTSRARDAEQGITYVPSHKDFDASFNLTIVPAPGAAALLALSGAIGGVRRRPRCE